MRNLFNKPIFYIFMAFCLMLVGSLSINRYEQTNALSYLGGYVPEVKAEELLNSPILPLSNSSLGDLILKGPSDTREDDLILTIKNDTLSNNVTMNYTIIGSDQKLFDEFKHAFKQKYTSQTAIGKLVCIKLSSNDAEIQKQIDNGIFADVHIFFPTQLLSKEYSMVIADSTSSFKATDNFKVDENYVMFSSFMLQNENYFALIYNNAYVIVWIFVVAFVAIFALAIIFKIRKMHKEDPEYYASLKREKQQKKYYAQKSKQKQQNQKRR